MARRRDRHDRGIRSLTLPSASPISRPRLDRQSFFTDCVQEAVDRVSAVDPTVLVEVHLGIEQVPYLSSAWSGDRVPLSAALEAAKDSPARLVLYERPIERRASSRAGLRRLVHRTLVEQLAAMTGRSPESLGLTED